MKSGSEQFQFYRLHRANVRLFAKIATSFLDFPFFVVHTSRTAFQKQVKKMAVKSFSAEERAEALQLLKDGQTLKEVAQQVGCSVASLQSWKKQAGGKKSGKKKKAKSKKKAAAVEATTECTCENCSCISFDEFARGYWAETPHAEKVLSLPPDMMPEAVKYINNVLKYAHDNLCK